MAWSLSDLTALETAMASGTLSVRFSDGRMVTYHSLDAQMRLRATMRAELGLESGADPLNTPGGVTYAGFDRN